MKNYNERYTEKKKRVNIIFQPKLVGRHFVGYMCAGSEKMMLGHFIR